MPKGKKHKLAKEEPLEHIEGSFGIVACDLSLYYPGFAYLYYNADTRTVSIEKVRGVETKKGTRKPHGQILADIANGFADFIAKKDVTVLVRERAFSRFNAEVQALNKVVGVVEMIAWQVKEDKFQEITPAAVKLTVTGSGHADKQDVADAIHNYVDYVPEMKSDNESDAAAVGIAWLIKNGYLEQKSLEKYTNNKEKSVNKSSEHKDG